MAEKTIKVIPPKDGGQQCRVIPPTEFGDRNQNDRLRWTNRTGAPMTVLLKAGLAGRDSMSFIVPDGQISDPVAPWDGATSGIHTYNVWCDLTNSPAIGNSEPEVVVEP